MPIIDNIILYEKIKDLANGIYKKNSAYKSGFIVKKYKEAGGTYSNDKKPKKLKQWFNEKWEDIGNKEYPVYRPKIKINNSTPLLVNEINKDNLNKQIKLKQILKGDYNLPKFIKK